MDVRDYNFRKDFDRFPVVMAYVPWQRLTNIYEDLNEALENGTIFPELDKPFLGVRGGCR